MGIMSELAIEVHNLKVPEPRESDLLDLAYAFKARGFNPARAVGVAADILESGAGLHHIVALSDYTPVNHITVSKELAEYFSDFNRMPN